MENEIFRSLSGALVHHLGASTPLVSGTGVRFKSERKGKATLYHDTIAAGNQAEVAFEVASMARRLHMTEAEFRSFVIHLSELTGRPVEPNSQYNWPRIGVASLAHVTLIDEALRQRLAANS